MAIVQLWRPLSRPQADSVSLRLGHGAALTCYQHVIYYRAAASLPKRGAKVCPAVHFTRGTARKSSPVTRTVTPPALTSNIRALKSSADSSGMYACIVTAAL